MSRRPPSLQGAKAPYISIIELREILNYAAKGKSNWTTGKLRSYLLKAGALTTIPEDPEAPIPRWRRRRSSRRCLYTTRNLLAEKLSSFYEVLLTVEADAETSRG